MANNLSYNNRCEWKDILYGIAIIAVVIGHSFSYESSIVHFVYLFHMPLFFILSGYLFNFEKYEHNFVQFSLNKLKRLIYPAFIACLLLYSNINPKWIVNFLYGSGKDLPTLTIMHIDFSLWFVYCLFIVQMLLWCILKINKKLKFNDFVVVVVALLVAYIGERLGKYFFYPWSFDVALVAVYFSVIGFYLKKYNLLFNQQKKWRILLIIILSVIVSYFNISHTAIFNMNERIYGNLILSLNGAVALTILFCYLSKIIEKIKLLQYLGMNSLIIMIVHGLFHSSINGFINCIFRILCSIIVIEILVQIPCLSNIFNPKSIFANRNLLQVENKQENRL